MSEVTITVSGRVGSGKSALCGEIEILCKALGLQVEWIGGRDEKNLTGADWIHEIEMYKPNVKIVEHIERGATQAPDGAQKDAGRNEGEEAMQAACAELPEGYNLEIGLENGAGWVDVIDPHGVTLDFVPDVDGGMTPRIRLATEFAIEHAASAGKEAR